MRVLITGGVGFIGSHIVDGLLDRDYEVSIVDDLSSGRKDNLNSKANFHEVDIVSDELASVFEEVEPDFVVHQAAQINVRKSFDDPVFDATSNIVGSLNILELCRKHDVKKVVYASSGGAIYGEPEYMPADELHPIRPLCPYGVSKHTVEHYIEMYFSLYGLDYTCLRYANVYGPRQDPFGEAGVVAIFAKHYLSGKTPTIFGDGNQSRDFVYVGDVADANVLALETETKSKAFNIGAGVESSVNDISDSLQQIVGVDIKPENGPEVKGEVRRIFLDVSLAAAELGWTPKTSLEEGMRKTVDYFRENE